MANRDDGGPAYPVPGLQNDPSFNGMSLRDWFAGKAISGILAHQEFDYAPMGGSQMDKAVIDAYRIADRMIEERAK